jgi:predicted alpha/beta-fold hydrolase
VVAVSPVLDPVATLKALQKSIPGYEAYFVRKWMRSLVKKQAAWPEHYDFDDFGQGNLTHMTDELVRRYTDFASLEDYLNGYAITGSRLADLKVPSHIITSLDDPIIPPNGLEQLARPPALALTVTRLGGHCGFFERLTGPTWLERRILGLLGARAVTDETLASAS